MAGKDHPRVKALLDAGAAHARSQLPPVFQRKLHERVMRAERERREQTAAERGILDSNAVPTQRPRRST